MRVSVILNPASGGGRLRAALSGIRRGLSRFDPEYLSTTAAGEEEQLARRAAEGGSDTIVVVGGDGTWGNAAHGIIASGRSPRVALLAAGTGNDFVKSVGAPAFDAAATGELIAAGAERRVDAGIVDGRVFLNCLGIGFDTAVLARSYRMRRVRGPVRYLAAALAELFSYRGERVTISPWPADPSRETLLTVFANGSWYGGMFHIAPPSLPDDGLLHAIRIADARGLRRLALLGAAIRGRHLGRSGVELASGSSFSLSFGSPPLLNTDGELRRASAAQLTVSVMPRALRVVAPAAATTRSEQAEYAQDQDRGADQDAERRQRA